MKREDIWMIVLVVFSVLFTASFGWGLWGQNTHLIKKDVTIQVRGFTVQELRVFISYDMPDN